MAEQQQTQIKHEQTTHREVVSGRVLSAINAPLWLVVAAAIPAVLTPLFFVYLPPDLLIKGSYGLTLINEYQKYAAELFALAITIGAFLFLQVKEKSWPHLPKVLIWPTLCFIFAIGASLFQAVDLWRGTLVGLQVYLLPTLFFLLVATRQWTLPQGLSILGLSLASGVLVAIIGIAQGLETWNFALALPHIGAGSLLYFQNLAGEYLIILIPPAIAIVFMPIRILYRVSAACTCVLLTTHLTLTLARGSWVGLIGGLSLGAGLACCGILFTQHSWRNTSAGEDNGTRHKYIPALVLSTIIVLVLVAGILITNGSSHSLFGSPYVQELLSINLNNTTGRLQIWSDSFDMLKENWLGGVGPGHYKVRLPAYLNEIPTIPYLFNWNIETGDLTIPFRPHNDYLQTWLELGLSGLLGMLWMFSTIFWITVRGIGDAIINKERIRCLMILGTFSGFAAWAVSMLFEFPFRMPASLVLGWLCAGLTVSFSLQHRELPPLRMPVLAKRLVCVTICLLIFASLLFAHQQFWSDLCVNQAIIAGANQNSTKSYTWIKKAYVYTPWKEQAGTTKAHLELFMDKPEEALKTTRETLQRNPNSLPGLWFNGQVAEALGYEQESRAAFQKIVTLFPFLPSIEKYQQLAER